MIITPGSTIGVLGGGQLGRMFTAAAQRMGYRVHVFSPQVDTPAGQVADIEITSAYDNRDAVQAFARHVDVVTYEFENIPVQIIDDIVDVVPVRPGRKALMTAQNRIAEKSALRSAGLPTADFAPVYETDHIAAFCQRHPNSSRFVVKSAESGYDGKGQMVIDRGRTPDGVIEKIGTHTAVVELWVDWECELSVIGARSTNGEIQCFGPVINQHHQHILDVSVAPANHLPQEVRAAAVEMTQTVLELLDVVGVLCVEFFLTKDGSLLINEIAPRPHNSGHLTIEAAVTSQFEQHVRAVCGLPLGSMQQLQPAAMANLLGDHLADAPLDWASLFGWSTIRLHLYGKRIPKSGRKMGHLTATAPSVELAESNVCAARSELQSMTASRAYIPVESRT